MQIMQAQTDGKEFPIGLVFGGIGPEHGVSCLSARSLLEAFESLGFDVVCVGITHRGVWVRVPNSVVQGYAISNSTLPEVSDTFENVALSLNPREPGFFVDSVYMHCDVVFPVVHGIGGEDGSIQGLFESAGISYVGSGVEASAISMNKVTSKRIAESSGIKAGNWLHSDPTSIDFTSADDPTGVVKVDGLNEIGFPLFVKPVSGGSSAGITLVHDASGLNKAIEIARGISSSLIIERALIAPRELEVAILQTSDGIMASPVGEIKVRPDFEFYDFEAKYLSDGAELITPANLDQETSDRIRESAKQIFQVFGCRDYARVDFFLTSKNEVIFNEINTIPGFTSISMFSRMWESGGWTFGRLVSQLIGNATARSIRVLDAGA